jgi:uncharacterized damage-inducible protein DinB
MWDEAWEGGLWAAPWKQSLDGLTAEQAAWRPAAGRHSIWAIAAHICFWREHELRRLSGESVPKEEVERRNYEPLEDTSDAAWQDLRSRFAETHRQLAVAFADERSDIARIQYLVPHDNYHIGQIMTLRALQGLPPLS